MAEYIRREDALEAFDEWIETTGAIPKGTSYYHECRGCIEDAPAADVAPVVHGRWELTEFWKYENKHSILYKTNRCSLCHYDVSSRLSYNYCPNCGARMDGE